MVSTVTSQCYDPEFYVEVLFCSSPVSCVPCVCFAWFSWLCFLGLADLISGPRPLQPPVLLPQLSLIHSSPSCSIKTRLALQFVLSVQRMTSLLLVSVPTSLFAAANSSVLVSWCQFTCLHCAVEVVVFPCRTLCLFLIFHIGHLTLIHSSYCRTPYVHSLAALHFVCLLSFFLPDAFRWSALLYRQ